MALSCRRASQVAHNGGIVVEASVVDVPAVIKVMPLAHLVPGNSSGDPRNTHESSSSLQDSGGGATASGKRADRRF